MLILTAAFGQFQQLLIFMKFSTASLITNNIKIDTLQFWDFYQCLTFIHARNTVSKGQFFS